MIKRQSISPSTILTPLAALFLLLSAAQGNIFAQPQERDHDDQLFFENPRRSSVSIRFELVNNLIVIPVSINESDVLHFIVDTGVNTTLITEIGIGEELELKSVDDVRIRGLGEGEPLEAYHSVGNTLEFEGIKGENQEVYVLKEDVFHLSSQMGREINGIFGFNIFRDFIVEINYGTRRITLHDPEQYRYSWWKRTLWTTKPINVVNNKPYVEANIKKDDNTKLPVRLMIDTGASHSIWLDERSDEEISAPVDTERTLLGSGLSGDLFGRKGRLEALEFGTFKLDNVIAAYPDSASIAAAMDLDGRHGSLGADVLNRFNVIFDYQNEQITFRRNLRYFRPFEHDMSGMTISNPITEMPIYMVSYVRPNSPADRAGVEPGDQITSVNNTSVSNYTLSELQGIFKSGEGREISLQIERDGETLTKRFRLEKLV